MKNFQSIEREAPSIISTVFLIKRSMSVDNLTFQ